MIPRLDAATFTHLGGRTRNEDAAVCLPLLGRFAVIDGMGGALAGDLAARLCADAVIATADPIQALQLANTRILEESHREPTARGMGCVATTVVVRDTDMFFAHVGDTLAMLATDIGCEILTRKHTLAAQQAERDGLVGGPLEGAKGSNQLTNDIGRCVHDDDRWIDRGGPTPWRPGDLLLLCSDGLYGAVPHDALTEAVQRARAARAPASDVARTLVQLAVAHGGTDNATAVVVRHLPEPSVPRTIPKALIARIMGIALVALTVFALGFAAGRVSAFRIEPSGSAP